MDFSKKYNLLSKDNKTTSILFIPIIILLGIVPLIVRMKVEALSEKAVEIFKIEEHIDFYSQSKAITIMGITILMLVLLFCFFDRKRVKKNKTIRIYILSAGLFLGFTALSTALSAYPDIALWGIHDRAEGMIIIGCYVIMMFYTLYVFRDIQDYKYITVALGIMIIVTTFIGVTQYIGKDILLSDFFKKITIPSQYAHIREDVVAAFKQEKITGTLYNPNYVGSLCAMTIPIFAGLIFVERNSIKRSLYLFLGLCNLLLLFGSGSRAGIMGIGGVIGFAIIIFSKKLWAIKKIGYKKIIALIGIIIIFTIITQELWYSKVIRLATDIKYMFVAEERDYRDDSEMRDYNEIKEIIEQDGKVVLVTQDNKMVIELGEEYKNFNFYDGENNEIDYIVKNNQYITEDARFSNFYFHILYMSGSDDLMAAIALLDSKDEHRGGEKISTRFSFLTDLIQTFRSKDFEDDKNEGLLNPLFLLNATEDKSIYIVDPFTQQRIVQETPEAIGFKGKEKVGSGRGYIWSRTIPMLKHAFFIGHGPDTYALEFPQREYLAKYYALYDAYVIVDKPHNLYLQIGVNNGIIALIGFLILILTYIIDSLRLYAFKGYYEDSEKIGIMTMLAVVGYLIAGMFNDSSVSVAPIFWVLLGVGMAINHLIKYSSKELIRNQR